MVVSQCCDGMQMSASHHWLGPWNLTHVVFGLALPVVGLMVVMPLMFLLDQDMSQHPPNQELVAKDLHGVEWRFRHIFRGDASLSYL